MKVRWLARWRPGGRLLEVGCGEGHFLAAAAAHGYSVAGIEPNSERARRASTRLGIKVDSIRIEEFLVESRAYDVVYHCDLLSHFDDPDLALRRMAELLRPKGVLFFEVGLYGSINLFWYRLLPDNSFPRHRWLFQEDGVRKLLDRTGLRIIRLQRFGLAPHILLYTGMSLLSSWLLQAGRSHNSSGFPDKAVTNKLTGPLAAWWHNFMRFRVGRVAPYWGPQTLFVLAAPKA